jgi:hypothetical protein
MGRRAAMMPHSFIIILQLYTPDLTSTEARAQYIAVARFKRYTAGALGWGHPRWRAGKARPPRCVVRWQCNGAVSAEKK